MYKELYNSHIKGTANTEKLYKIYEKLTDDEINTLIDIIISEKHEKKEYNKTNIVVLYLALFSYASGDKLPKKLYDSLLENQIYYYGEMYLRATEDTAKELISILESEPEESKKINSLLCAIAAIPSLTSKDFLVNNSKEPLPAWTKKLYVLPIEYSKVMGWTVNSKNEIISLISEKVIPLKKCDKADEHSIAPFKILEKKCAFCHQHLVLVLDHEERLATCVYCSCYQTIFTKEVDEKIIWHPKNTKSEILSKDGFIW